MNKTKLILSAVCLCAFASGLFAAAWPHQLGIGGADANTEVFSIRSANVAHLQSVHSNLAYTITSASPIGEARVSYVSIFTDAGVVVPLTSYVCTNSLTITASQAASTNRFTVASTATLATNDFLIIRSTNDTYQLLCVSNIDSATIVATYQATTNAVNSGDTLYEMTPASTRAIANLSAPVIPTDITAPGGVFHGQQGTPFLLTVGASNATPSLHISGEYYRRPRP